MAYDATDLMPGHPRALVRRVGYKVPLTPFFLPPASSAIMRMRAFHGRDFFPQYKSTEHDAGLSTYTNDPICGFAAYRILTTADPNPLDTTPENGTRTLSYHANTVANTFALVELETGHPAIGLTYNRTATTSSQRETEYIEGESEDFYTTFTLSEEVTKAWLETQFDSWFAQSEGFRAATSAVVSTYYYSGYCATQSGGDGYLAIVAGGDVVAEGAWFSGTPEQMSGDEGDEWNGNYSTHLLTVVRKNAPVLHRESSVSGSGGSGGVVEGSPNQRGGLDIYRAGYAEIQLEEPSEKWLDEWGVYTSGSTALEPLPLQPVEPYEFTVLLSHITGAEAANQLTLVSRTGKKYRVTIQIGASEWDGPTEIFTTEQTHTIVTSASTLRGTLTLTSEPAGNLMRVAKIEHEVITNGDPAWVVVADIAAWEADPESSPFPGSLIGPDVVGNYLLLAAIQYRRGARFGHPALDGSAAYYLKKTFRKHLSPGTLTPHSIGCGLGAISGSADLEWVEQYNPDTGILAPRNVTAWSLILNDVDWTQESYAGMDSVSFPGSSVVTSSATLRRHEGSFSYEGRFLIFYDLPDPAGAVLSSSWAEKAVAATAEEQCLASPLVLEVPSSGQSAFFEGHRLTYNPAL